MTTTSTVDSFAGLGLDAIGKAPTSATQTESSERFLKMLVAQMENQDPLNPLDNAQVTSQIAQINTVAGLEQVNISVKSLSTQLLQMQTLQGAALVGRDVTLKGDRLSIEGGAGHGGFELADKASSVRIEVLGPNNTVVDTLDLGAQSAGRHYFDWPAGRTPDSAGLRFRVVATNGGKAVGAEALTIDRVRAISTDGDHLTLELQRSGTVPTGKVVAFN